MSDGEAVDETGRPDIAVLVSADGAADVVETIRAAGGVAGTATAETVAGTDLVIAPAGDAIAELATADVSTPVLPIADDLRPETAKRLLDGRYTVAERPLVAVETAGGAAHALFDVTLATAAAATISEFSLNRPDRSTSIARFRADGVVVTTPAGSRGYAHTVGGPIVAPGSDVLTAVPISPFATDPNHWVVPLAGLSLTVERDDADVELLVDGRTVETVEPGATVELARAGTLPIVSLPDGDRE
ncbi:ATP-NAD/AcoX kinase [Halococcus morrhuae DSM 1307]|uniref:ATP-NAD/AcoX kinase n=1 Tax=Halococcus morrhuae DSM 1307 TaxID=931277 RepID=M0M3P1_HALMO|nr:NAD(+)/NADH kinase [Halococcus morrhuae]EMA40326.1 ATP-NAD/AcoX kinase [Halococcus morrhuae DSM 1307]